jgi:large subunit ribosomal protein L22
MAVERLWVVDASADEGPTLKRFRPRSQGRAFAIHKPMTHITVVVSEKEG